MEILIIKALNDFARLSPAKCAVFGLNTVTKMSDNPDCTDPEVPLADISTKSKDCQKKAAAAKKGGTKATKSAKESKMFWLIYFANSRLMLPNRQIIVRQKY